MNVQALGALAVSGAIALSQITGIDTNVATWLATPTAANMRTAMGSDRTGTGLMVFNDTPTLVTPVLGAATGTSLTLGASAATGGLLNVPASAASTVLAIKGSNGSSNYALISGFGADSYAFGTSNINAKLSGATVTIDANGSTKLTLASALTTSANPISIGTNPATTGTLNFLTTGTIYIRNAANSADLKMFGIDGSNNATFGSNDTNVGNVSLVSHSSKSVILASGGGTNVNVGSTIAQISTKLQIGNSGLASTGQLNFANTGSIYFRNGANSADLQAFTTDSANNIFVGSSSNASIYLDSGASSVFMRFSGTAAFTQTSAATTLTTPLTTSGNILTTAILRSSVALAAATSGDGAFLQGSTAAAAGNTTQYSPRIHLRGSGYNSVSTLGEFHDFACELIPTTAAGATAASMVFSYAFNLGAYVEVMRLLSTKGIQLPTGTTPPTPPAGSLAMWYDGTNLKALTSGGVTKTFTWS